MSIKISHQFDGGAIEVVRAERPEAIELKLRADSHADIIQWFYFRLQGARDCTCTMRIMNAGMAAYPAGWEGYSAFASYDLLDWFRVPTSYDGHVMTICHMPEQDSVYFAYFEPYSWERHLKLLGRAQASTRTRLLDLGSTVDGRDVNLLVIGNPEAAKKIWVTARQHPGETMAEWFAEGMIDALLDDANPVARALLERCVFYVVPNMNPDGAVRGNLRTNAAGVDLNRQWISPSIEHSPEVFLVKNKMRDIGCDLFIDVHGDESLPYVFMAGADALDDFTPSQLAAQRAFIADFKLASPDMQDQNGYPPGPFTAEMLSIAAVHIAHSFKCLALALEMPFKDNANHPDARVGWNGARSANLGREILQPIMQALNRGEV